MIIIRRSTDANRDLTITGLPQTIEGITNAIESMDIRLRYKGESSGAKAIVLDNIIIPCIVNMNTRILELEEQLKEN